MVRAYKRGRPAEWRRDGFETRGDQFEVEDVRQGGITDDWQFSLGVTKWMAASLLNIIGRSKSTVGGVGQVKILSSVVFILSLRCLWNLQWRFPLGGGRESGLEDRLGLQLQIWEPSTHKSQLKILEIMR